MMNPDSPYRAPSYSYEYKGYVRDNNDPQKRGRIRVYCPQIGGEVDDEKHWLPWAEAKWPWMGGVNAMDFGSPPTIEQQGGKDLIGVWIRFEGGHPDFPIWDGTFTVAPTPDDPQAQIDLTNAGGTVGASIIESPPAGSSLTAINPPGPRLNEQETRLLVRKGRDIVIGSVKGGYIIVGPSGVQIVGAQVTINGVLHTSSAADSLVK